MNKKREYLYAYRRLHPEVISAINRRSYLKRRDRILLQKKEYSRTHREQINARRLIWKAKNRKRLNKNERLRRNKIRGKINARERELYPFRDKEELKKTRRNWASRNRHKIADFNHRRRTRIKDYKPEDCSDKIRIINKECFCRWCCARLDSKNRSVDHVIPISRGGRHIPDNLVASCRKCNYSKGDKLLENWLPYQKFAA